METTGRLGERGAAAAAQGMPADARRSVDGYLMAGFPWYGLDEAFTGPRWLMRVGAAADGIVEYGSTGHGEEPSLRVETDMDQQRFTVVVTVASRPGRDSADGTGKLEATSVSSAAWLAGSGLLSCTWPTRMERVLRQDWLDQQTAIAWELADDLEGENWSQLSLPVDGVPTDFHYRESEYGWVLAGTAGEDVHIGAYGRGMSAYGLGFAVVKDITRYDS
ncbi:hypothetical protein [Streptomyces violaceusniger]|uniref:hypothetical protein n=1 Tax=Streptomyces violaceusniger TaxID=68280 RepID=UPI000995F8AD|nr:hypothetical protein [Streptomyces hygroscopicus]AQW53204.1 hypothetical protein SHXM_06667 [Streptomyces hygroscopicus]